MPQVDLVTACAGGSCDNKIACETVAASDKHADSEADPRELPPDFPPDSFWLSKDAELDWLNRNAYIERKDSGRASHSTNLNPNINPNSTSSSQRFSILKSKASMIGLPKPQKSCFIDAKNRRNRTARLFPKRSASTGKSVSSSLSEPTSPKVSCMGRVRSRRDRNRRLKNRQLSKRSRSEPEKKKDEPDRRQKKSSGGGVGFLASFRSIFRPSRKHAPGKSEENDSHSSRRMSRSASVKKTRDFMDRLPVSDGDARRVSVGSDGSCEPVGLGAIKKFASGRRSDVEWGVGADVA